MSRGRRGTGRGRVLVQLRTSNAAGKHRNRSTRRLGTRSARRRDAIGREQQQ